MNVYDFDKTIYDGDSTVDFIKYSMAHQPHLWIYLPSIAFRGLLYGCHILSKQQFKEHLYAFFGAIHDRDAFMEAFVDSHMDHMKAYYLAQKKEDDVIISASPQFMVAKFCNRVGIKNVMGSVVDKDTGKYSGLNCWGPEKVRRFYDVYPEGIIDEFYSDSHSDDPLAHISRKAYLVKGEKLIPWS